MKKSPLLACLAIAVLAAGLSGCGKPKGSQGLRIAVIPKGTTHEFWKSIHAGALKAEEELKNKGIDTQIIWKGPLREDDRDLQIQVVENFASSGVNGIVLAPLDDTALVAPVETASRSNVPVVIIDSGLNTDQYVSFVATDNFKGGQIAGEHMAKLLTDAEGKTAGNVLLFRYQAGSASTTKREEGFLDGLKAFPDIKVIADTDYGGATLNLALNQAQNILGREGMLGQLNGVFCPNETLTVAMTMALKEVNRAKGQVKVIGFDTGRESVLDLQNGDIQGLIVQNPILMGYGGVMTLVSHLNGDKVEKRIDTGVTLITQENMYEKDQALLLNPPIDEYLNSKKRG